MVSLHEPRLLDVRHHGRERVIGCWELGGAVVDPGPESCLENLLEGLAGRPRALLLTHIHLDHAGASGALVERFPDLEIWVHERGAPHLADPSRLVRSAARLYGDDLVPLFGRVVPVPERNLRIVRGGEVIEAAGRRIEVHYAPGHASHHVLYLDSGDSTAYVGDVAGVRIPPASFVLAPTPPPDVDLEQWHATLDLLGALAPERLALTHFGAVEDVSAHLEDMRNALRVQSERARALLEASGADTGGPAQEEFVAFVRERVAKASDPETALVYEQAAPPDQLWMGLARYWRKREVEAARA